MPLSARTLWSEVGKFGKVELPLFTPSVPILSVRKKKDYSVPGPLLDALGERVTKSLLKYKTRSRGRVFFTVMTTSVNVERLDPPVTVSAISVPFVPGLQVGAAAVRALLLEEVNQAGEEISWPAQNGHR